MAINNKPASAYAKPHTMSGGSVTAEGTLSRLSKPAFASDKSVKDAGVADPVPNGVSYGRSGEPKTDGVTMRGYGAATKGIKSRGPMA